MAPSSPLVIFLAFANEAVGDPAYLRNVREEQNRLHDIWDTQVAAGRCELVELPSATVDRIFQTFHDPRYRGRIAIFHYGGHADSGGLLLETEAGNTALAHAGGLARFLGRQSGLQLVFLNGCSTQPQVQKLQDAGIPVVIATSRAIDDEAAMTFAEKFYEGVANNISLQEAFDSADDFLETESGDDFTRLYRNVRILNAPSPLKPDRPPWEFYIRPEVKDAGSWNLPLALDDPLMGLPALPLMDLPQEPFRSILWFEREHAPIFFGRGHDILALYRKIQASEGDPIILLHGQSGVGKSSLLAAGLLPRLEQEHQVVYRRRNASLGLVADLDAVLQRQGQQDIRASWLAQEADNKPLVVILDQVEEAYLPKSEALGNELAEFVARLHTIFADRTQRPRGKLILSFRKEWFAEVEKLLADHSLPKTQQFLTRLDRKGILEAVTGPARSGRLQDKYQLQIDSGLPEEIADDLLVDPGSALAPTLQILLSKLWRPDEKENQVTRHFSQSHYRELKSKGLLLSDFLNKQIDNLKEKYADAGNSGLALDLLYFHTTDLSTAARRAREELHSEYNDKESKVLDLVAACRNLYLLVEVMDGGKGSSPRSTQLAHDTLAPLVRRDFEQSELPGQRARRILEGRVGTPEHPINNPDPLDEVDLKQVEIGQSGMRSWRIDEGKLVERSQDERTKREMERLQRQRNARLFITAIIVLAIVALGLAGWAFNERRNALTSEATAVAESTRANNEEIRAESAATTAIAERATAKAEAQRAEQEARNTRRQLASTLASQSNLVGEDSPTVGLLLAIEAISSTLRIDEPIESAAYQSLRNNLSRPLGVPLQGHNDTVNSLAFSPDGKYLASGSWDSTVRLWPMEDTTIESIVLQGHSNSAYGLSFDLGSKYLTFSPDGRSLAWADLNDTIRLWNMDDPTTEPLLLQGQPYGRGIHDLEFSPDSKYLTWADDDSRILILRMNDVTSQPVVFQGHTQVFSPDGKVLVFGVGDDTLSSWRVGDFSIQPFLLRDHVGKVGALVFSPDGKFLASGSDDGTVHLWSMVDSTGDRILLQGATGEGFTLAFSPNGKYLASGSSDGPVRVWSTDNLADDPFQLQGLSGQVLTLTFSPDSEYLAMGSSDNTVLLLTVNDPSSDLIHLQGHTGEVLTLAFSADSEYLASSGEDGTIRVWNINNLIIEPIRLEGPKDYTWNLAFSPDGKFLVSDNSDHNLHVWSMDDLMARPTLLQGHEDIVHSLALSPDGTWLASASWDGTILLWHTFDSTVEPIVLQSQVRSVNDIAFSPDGNFLASASSDNIVRLWHLHEPTAEPIALEGHTDMVTEISFSPNGTYLASSGKDRKILLWRMDDPTASPNVLQGHVGEVTTLAFSPNGRYLASGGDDGALLLWNMDNITTGPRRLRQAMDSQYIYTVIFSPDGNYLASGSSDNAVRLWRIDDLAADPITLLGHIGEVLTLAFSPDSNYLASGGNESTVRLWNINAPNTQPIELNVRSGRVYSLAFSPEGEYLASGGEDPEVSLWHMDVMYLMNLACRYTGRNFTWKEWNSYFRGELYHRTCEEWPIDPYVPQDQLDRINDAGTGPTHLPI